MEKEKKKSGFLPLSILVSLIQAGENIWSEIGIPSQEDIEKIKNLYIGDILVFEKKKIIILFFFFLINNAFQVLVF